MENSRLWIFSSFLNHLTHLIIQGGLQIRLNHGKNLHKILNPKTADLEKLCNDYISASWLQQPEDYNASPPFMLEFEQYLEHWNFRDSHGAVFPFFNVDDNKYFYAQVVTKTETGLKSPFFIVEYKKGVFPWSAYFSNFDLICRGKINLLKISLNIL